MPSPPPAFFCPKRNCYVLRSTNKRMKGLAKRLQARHHPSYTPPRGLGERIGPAGLAAGAAVDRAVSALIEGQRPRRPAWAVRLATRVLSILEKAKM